MAVKVPKGVKLPWGGGRAIAYDGETDSVVVGGESGRLARVDTSRWKATPATPVRGFVNSLSLSRGGERLAIGVAGASPAVEVRDPADLVVATWPTQGRNARVGWSPSGERLVAVLEPSVDQPMMDIVVYDTSGALISRPDIPGCESIAVCWLDEDTLLALGRRAGVEGREGHRVIRVDVSSAAVEDLGVTEVWDVYRRIDRVAPDRVLVTTYNWGWALLDDHGRPVAVRERPSISAACVDGDGFSVAAGRQVLHFDTSGVQTKQYTARRTVAAMARARERLLLLSNGTEGALELVDFDAVTEPEV